MAKTFHLTVAQVGKNLFDGEAFSATMPGTDGVFQILAHHEPLISELAAGEMRIMDEHNQQQRIELTNVGIAEISNNQATILL